MTDSRRTPLYDDHLRAGARMVPFAGFDMPVQYAGVVEEHRTVRRAVGLFDVSHMGEVVFTGPKAQTVVDRIVTNHVSRLVDGQACYTVMCRPDGGIIDDLVVYKFSPQRILICVNAANRAKDFEWMQHQANGECDVVDEGDAWAQIAVQGPRAAELVGRLAQPDPTGLATYHFQEGDVAGVRGVVARTGYTGEDGFELYVPSDGASTVWNALLERGRDLEVAPAGLGARDSLRLEMAYPLYGNDITEDTNPYEAGLGWVVKLKKPVPCIGHASLAEFKAQGPTRRLAPIVLRDRGIARAGYDVLDGASVVGSVTSGTMAPSVGKAIALAYVPAALATEGTELFVSIRGKSVPASVVKRPFLQR
jgi:aminomethyltransferase